MSNYADYFGELASKGRTDEEQTTMDYGSILNHKYNRTQRNYQYTHPNQLRTMTASYTKKVSHSKQNDLLGAIEMLTYKPPEILPISDYTKQTKVPTYGSGKPKPFVISETENLSKPPSKRGDKKPIEPVKPPIKPPMKPKYDTSKEDDMLKNLIKQGLATVPKRNDKVPDRVLKLEAQQKKDKALLDRVNKPLVSKPKPVIRIGFKGGNNKPIVSTI
tara:strand:+ start:633 stop:1286 length:654 start_codon:yes stop_codon:yes gene_type:complete